MSKLISFGKSDIGLKRSNNEDSFLLKPDLGFFAVADGMGGPASGEVASKIFTETVLEFFSKARGQSEEETLELVQNAFRSANDGILNMARTNPQYHGMGCTAEVMVFYNRGYVLGHVGDSRTYIFRQGQLKQITRDHSLIQDQIEQGLITPVEAGRHSLRHVILRAVGIYETLAVDLIRGKSLPGDIFLLCSDGLTDMVDDAIIKDTLSLSIDIAQKAAKLVESAKSEGGNDNITVILCEAI
jgi:protein phosphatase